MVAIAKEKAVAEYLLVEVDSSEEKGIFSFFYYLKLYHLKWLIKLAHKKLIDRFINIDIKHLTKELPDYVDQHPECCNGPLCTMPGGNLCTRCPKCPCHLCRLPVCKKTRKTPGSFLFHIRCSLGIIVFIAFLSVQ